MDIESFALSKRYTKEQVNNIMALSPLSYKGSVANYEALPTGAAAGNLYTVLDTTDEYLWTGSEWIKFGNQVTLNMITEIQNKIKEISLEVVTELPEASSKNYLQSKVIFEEGTDNIYTCLKKDDGYF